jgi:CelD/BcsL family acetyltransferase involved in cellulose biosynthesis
VQVLDIRAPRDVDRGYDMLLEVERSSWKHAHGTAISAVPRQTGFYRDLCHGAAAQNRLHLQLLTVGGDPVAYNLGYVRDNRYYYLKTSYVDAYKRLHVSTCLRATLVKALIESGIREMDFPAEPYEWERQWTEQVRWHKVVSVYRPTLAGRALALAERLRHTFEPPRTIAHVDPRAHRPQ